MDYHDSIPIKTKIMEEINKKQDGESFGVEFDTAAKYNDGGVKDDSETEYKDGEVKNDTKTKYDNTKIKDDKNFTKTD